VTDEQRRALERVRDSCAVLGSFLHARTTDVPRAVRRVTYRQLTGDLMDAVAAAHSAGVPEPVIFDNM
jgi:hypothetical protein